MKQQILAGLFLVLASATVFAEAFVMGDIIRREELMRIGSKPNHIKPSRLIII